MRWRETCFSSSRRLRSACWREGPVTPGARELLVVKAVVEFHWGYSIKRPAFSAAQPALLVPPPTTLLGALAKAAASLKGWPEAFAAAPGGALYSSAARILELVPWAALALRDERFVSPLLGIFETRDITRALIAPYLRRANVRPDSPFLFAVQPHGKVYAPSMRADVLFLARSREVGEWALGLQSLGSKEGVVSTLDVEVAEARPRGASGAVETSYYFPSRLRRLASGSAAREVLSMPSREYYRLGEVRDVASESEEFVVPLGRVAVTPSPDAAVIEDPSGEAVLVPRAIFAAGGGAL